MKEDAENRRWYAQQLAEKKLRGECVFHVQGGYDMNGGNFCITHDCPVVRLPTQTHVPTYKCLKELARSSSEP